MDRQIKNGFTLIEMVLTLAIIGLLILVAVPSLQSTLSGNFLHETAEEMVDRLRTAQSRSMKGREHGVYLDKNRFILFAGKAYKPGHPDNSVHELGAELEITGVALNQGRPKVVFESLTGTTRDYGSFKIQISKKAKYALITINEQGVAEVNFN